MNAEIFTASDELVSAVLNGLYQGIILTLLVCLVLRFIGATNAATRYGVWGVTLLLVIAIIPAHYLRHRLFPESVPDGSRGAMLPSSPTSPADMAPARDLPGSAAPSVANQITAPGPEDNASLAPVESTTAGTVAGLTVGNDLQMPAPDSEAPADPSLNLASRSNPSPAPEPKRAWGVERILNPASWKPARIAVVPKMASLLLLLAWLLIALFRAGLLLGRLFQIRKVKQTALPAGPELGNLFSRLRDELAVHRKVELKVCPAQVSPVALGFFHPLILLPEEQGRASSASGSETEHILRHELAHVHRRDDWANLAQNFIQAALFFHPAVWWISRRLSLEREIACDDQVLHRGAGARSYALLLAELAGRLKRQDLVFAQGVSSSKSQLQQRINMILDTRRNTSPGLAKARLGFVTTAAALLVALALYSAPRLVLAQSPTSADAATTPRAENANINVASAGAPVALVASAEEPDAAPAPPAAPDVGPGPKFKPGQPGAEALPPVPAVPPAAISVSPLPPPAPAVEIAGDVKPMPAPRPPTAAFGPGGGSLEERIERLEKMVRSLMDQGPKRAHGAIILRGRSGDEASLDQKEMEKMNEKMKDMAKRQAERAQQQAERAQEQSKRAEEMAQRANKDFNFKWNAGPGLWDKGMHKEGLEKQLEALRKAKEGLERQMENLDRQIERVERDQERMQNEQERRSELRDEEPKEETPSVAEANEQ